MLRPTRSAFRGWAAGLHGGQLVILWVVAALAAFGIAAGAAAAGDAATARAKEAMGMAGVKVRQAGALADQLANLPEPVGPLYAAYLRDRASQLVAALRTDGLSPERAQDSLRRAMPWGPAVRAAPDDSAAVDSIAALQVRAKARSDSRTARWVNTGMVAALLVAGCILGMALLATWDWFGAKVKPQPLSGG